MVGLGDAREAGGLVNRRYCCRSRREEEEVDSVEEDGGGAEELDREDSGSVLGVCFLIERAREGERERKRGREEQGR